MIYLSSFGLSNEDVVNPDIYPYNVFHGKDIEPFMLGTLNAKIYNMLDTFMISLRSMKVSFGSIV